MGFESKNSGIAAAIFLGLYVVYFGFVSNIVYRKGWKTVYTALWFFGLFRVGGQLCGLVFATLGFKHWQWLIAYLVLSAEGYFSLILASFYFVVQCQIRQNGKSWLRKCKDERNPDNKHRCGRDLDFSTVFHLVLIPANAFIIGGGTTLTGVDTDKWDQETGKINTSKGLRTAGLIIFLIQTFWVVFLACYIYFKEHIRLITMYLLFAALPFLVVRGIFGILSIYIDEMNYYDLTNYTEDGLKSKFVAYEYCLATTMEFVASVLLIMSYYVDKDTQKIDEEQFTKMESNESSLK